MRFFQIFTLTAALLALSASGGKTYASSCKTLKAEMIGFGEQSTRAYAEIALNRKISDWETRYGVKAQPKGQKMACKDYIKWLNEFECTAEAVLCR